MKYRFAILIKAGDTPESTHWAQSEHKYSTRAKARTAMRKAASLIHFEIAFVQSADGEQPDSPLAGPALDSIYYREIHTGEIKTL